MESVMQDFLLDAVTWVFRAICVLFIVWLVAMATLPLWMDRGKK